jgi:hypothetical protein
MGRNPFDEEGLRTGPVNPFGEEEQRPLDPAEAAATIEHSAARIRRLKQQVGAEGLSLSATRELIDQLTRALDAAAGALRNLNQP